MSARNGKPNIIQRLGKRFMAAGTWRPQTISELDRWLDTLTYGMPASSGAYVSEDTAVNFSAFFSGVFQICQTIASCPTTIYKQTEEFVKAPWSIHPAYRLLTKRANPFMDAFVWKELMQYGGMVWGNGYSFIERDGSMRPVGLWPLNSGRMTPRIDTESNPKPRLVYDFIQADNTKKTYQQWEIFHLRGFGPNGIMGYSILEIAREALGLGISQQEFSGRFLSNGAHLGGILSVKGKLSDPAKERLKVQFSQLHGGVSKTGGVAVFEEEMDYKTLGMPLADAQFLESKVFQIAEIARFLNISPYKLKDYSHATFSNIEHLGIEYATDTIRPWAERWEAAIDTQLLTDSEQNVGFSEFDLAAIHRGDFKTQAEGYNMLRNAGAYNADEIRYKLGDNPIKDPRVGRMYWKPANMDDASIPKEAQNAQK